MLSHHSDDFDSLRKRYEELLVSRNQAVEKLDLAQDETNRLSKQCEDISQERTNAVIKFLSYLTTIVNNKFFIHSSYVI